MNPEQMEVGSVPTLNCKYLSKYIIFKGNDHRCVTFALFYRQSYPKYPLLNGLRNNSIAKVNPRIGMLRR